METKVSIEVWVTDISPTVREVVVSDGDFSIITSPGKIERSANIPLGEIQALIDALTIVRDATPRAATGDDTSRDTRVTLIDCHSHEWRPVPGNHDAYALFVKGNDEDSIRHIEYIRRMYSPLKRADNGEPFA